MNQSNLNPTNTNEAHSKRPDLSELDGRLKRLRLPMMRSIATQLTDQAARENWSYLEYLSELTDHECLKRTENRISRHLKKSALERNKLWSEIRWNRLPMAVQQRMQQLQTGEFLGGFQRPTIFGTRVVGRTVLCQTTFPLA